MHDCVKALRSSRSACAFCWEAMPNELAMFDDSDNSTDEALPYKCDGCRGPVYFLPLREAY